MSSTLACFSSIPWVYPNRHSWIQSNWMQCGMAVPQNRWLNTSGKKIDRGRCVFLQMKSTLISKNIHDQHPILCDRCLGENPYVKMTKDNVAECKVCLKPYVGFRWRPGKSPRFLSTLICQVCARIKNVCQACILDLKYGITVKMRDSALGVETNPPKQGANLEYYLATNAAKVLREDGTLLDYRSLKKDERERLAGLSNEFQSSGREAAPRPCSFFSKGKCNRGASCPYLHDLVVSTPQTLKSLREKYYGTETDIPHTGPSPKERILIGQPGQIHAPSTTQPENLYGAEIEE